MLATPPPTRVCTHRRERFSRQPRGHPGGRVQPREHLSSSLSPRWEALPSTLVSQGNWVEETDF